MKNLGENHWGWLEELLRQQKGHVSCVFKSLKTGESYAFQEDFVHPSASVIKIFLMSFIYQLVEDGILTETQPVPVQSGFMAPSAGVLNYMRDVREMSVRDLVELMIIVSDNSATNILLELVGLPQMQEYLKSCGYTATQFQRRMMDFEAAARGEQNYTSASETARILERIYLGKEVSPAASAKMLQTLRNQQAGDLIPWHLGEVLEEGQIAHKTGGLPGVVHDAAIVDGGKEPFILCMFGSETDVPAFGRLIGDAALEIYQRYRQ